MLNPSVLSLPSCFHTAARVQRNSFASASPAGIPLEPARLVQTGCGSQERGESRLPQPWKAHHAPIEARSYSVSAVTQRSISPSLASAAGVVRASKCCKAANRSEGE